MESENRQKFEKFISRPGQYETLIKISLKSAGQTLGIYGIHESDGKDALTVAVTALLTKIDAGEFKCDSLTREEAIAAILSNDKTGNAVPTDEQINDKITETDASIFASWIIRFTRNHLNDRRRRRTNVVSANNQEAALAPKAKQQLQARFLPIDTKDDSLIENIARHKQQMSLEDKLNNENLLGELNLNEIELKIATLRLQGLGYKEIGAKLGMNEKAVMQRFNRSMAKQTISRDEMMGF